MLNNKHIIQWTGYLLEDSEKYEEIQRILLENPDIDKEIDKIFIEMYKKGYGDGVYDKEMDSGTR